MCKDNDKLRLLEDQLNQAGEQRVIVFVNTKAHCDVVSRHCDHLGYRCTVLHGGKTQVGAAAEPEQAAATHLSLPCRSSPLQTAQALLACCPDSCMIGAACRPLPPRA